MRCNSKSIVLSSLRERSFSKTISEMDLFSLLQKANNSVALSTGNGNSLLSSWFSASTVRSSFITKPLLKLYREY